MSKEQNQIPEWALPEREREIAWIQQNLDVFRHTLLSPPTPAGPDGRGA